MYCTIYTIFFVFKSLRVCNFAKLEENIYAKIQKIMYGYVETNTQISEFTQHLVWKFHKFTFFRNVAKC